MNNYTSAELVEVYGSNCFSNAVMRERLPKNAFKEIVAVQNGEKELSFAVADVVATAMRDWAIEHGATHYTHWFHPLTGLTAEKHDSFITPTEDGRILMEFSGKALIKGEPDASSFPSGGLRATFEARGYTAWDVTSPAFLKKDPTGTTLCIPTAFFSYHGHALDKKVPLLRSMDALSKQATRLLHALGSTNVRRCSIMVGAEQEYFLVDRAYYNKRPDLMLTGRTVFGSMPAKGQEMEDHYFGALNERVSTFMRELNWELWKLGVAAKTQHNEVAPNQFEIVPVFSTANTTVDANQMVMETIKKVARRHDMEALLHEKPFAGVNGSGKHNNWSIITDEGINVFEPGENPESNARFLLFAIAVVEAVDRFAPLLRSSVATAGNDHRLGANEAPPPIISVFFGDILTEILEDIANGKAHHKKGASKIKLGVTSLPSLPVDLSDRNRTSPLAFTGNKFEFRMLGSFQSIATANTYLNTAVAQVFSEFAEILEKTDDINLCLQEIIKKSYSKHRRIVFNGNGYSEQWVQEALERGLPNITSTVDALGILLDSETVELFERHHVLNREELESRFCIYLQKYSRQINIEAGVMVDMAKRSIFPSASAFASRLAQEALSLRSISAESSCQEELAKKTARLLSDLTKETEELERVLHVAQENEDFLEQARAYREAVLPAMHRLRSKADCLEKIIAKDFWPFPTYEDLLFRL